MRFKLLLSAAMLLCCQWLSTAIYSQTITATASSFTSLTGDAGITFVVNNSNTSAVLLNDLSSYRTTGSNGVTYSLWYSSTSLSGTSTIGVSTWTKIATASPANVSASAISPIFTGLGFAIPGNTTYRFVLMSTGTINYGSAGTNTASSGGINIYTGNYNISGSNVGYSGSGNSLSTTPRYFNGTLVFSNAGCTIPITQGSASASASTVCANSPVQLNLAGHSKGVGQTYQWQSATSATGTFTNIGSSAINPPTEITPTNTLYYRVAITCGTTTAYSSSTLVNVTPGLAAGTYSINPSAPASATNFQNFAAVATALTCGISGPVTFNIASGTYTNQVYIPQLPGTGTNSRLTFQSATGNPADVTIQFSSTGTANNYVVQLDGASYITLKNLTIKNNGTTYARGLQLVGSAANDSIVGCVITGATTTTSSNSTARIFADDVTGSNNVILNNTIQNGSYGIYTYGLTTSLPNNWIIQGNTVTNANNYSMYLYYHNNLKVRNNEITTASTATHYGINSNNNTNEIEITGNKVTTTGSGTKYGIVQNDCDASTSARGLVANNVIYISNGSSTVYGLRGYYGNYQRYYNNTVNVTSTSATASYAAYFYQSSTSYANNEIRNNIFSNSGGGYAMHVYNPALANNNSWDYNNLYTTGAKLVDRASSPATDYADLTAWRAASGMDKNSISYDPGFTSATNLIPDPANAASWSINGRGVHLTINNKDINGNTRATTLAAGVPDLGAYEFTPTSTPPAATAIPAAPAAGSTQYFLFGQDTVASINWAASSTVPASITVRQYTGTVPPQMLTASPNSYMYFYTDISAATGTYDYTPNIYYKDPWLGKVTGETNLKLVKKLGTGSWIPYNFTESSADAGRNIITSPGRTTLGYFSGIDNDILFIAKITPSSNFFCPGGSVTLTANMGTNITYKWKLNGSYITGATSISYVANAVGSYTVEETRNSAVVESEEVTINTINPPAATISAARNVICIGGSETLDANTGTNLTYQWQFNGANIPSATAATYSATSAGNYTVIVTNPGCSTTSVPTNVTAVPLPMATLTPDTTVILCNGSLLTMNASVPSTGLNIAYQWQLNGLDIPGANAPTYSTSVGGNYTLVLSSSTCPVTVSPGTSVINTPAPTPAITGTGLTLSTGAYSSYQWYKNGAPIAGAKNFSYTVTENGSYAVEVSNGGCTGMSEVFNVRNVGIKDLAGIKNNISIYPNPTSNVVNINAPVSVNVVLAALDGRVIMRASNVKQADLSNYPEGVYLLKLYSNDNILLHTEKVVKSSR